MAEPAGWTLVGNRSSPANELQTRVWTRVADATDAGKAVGVVTLGAPSKFTLTVAAYSGVDTASPVAASSSASETATTAAHTTPGVAAAQGGDWLLSYWMEKSSVATSWNAPGGQSVRSQAIGSGTGRVNSLLTDNTSGAGGITATANGTSNKAVMWSIVLDRG